MIQWRKNLYILWISQIMALMGLGICLPFLPYFIQKLGVLDPDKVKWYTGLLNSVAPLGIGLMAPVWGSLADKFGRKKMFLRAVICLSFVLVAMGLSRTIGQLIFFRTLHGLLTGTMTAATALIVTGTPENKLSSAVGFFSSSTFIGISAGPVLGGLLVEFIGYRNCFFLGAALAAVDFLLVFFLVEEIGFKNTNKKTADRGGNIINIIKMFTFSGAMMMVILMMVRFSRTVFIPFLPLFIQDIRGTIVGAPRITGIIQAITGLGTAISGIFIGKIAEKRNKYKILTIVLFTSSLISIPAACVNNLIYFSIIIGIFYLTIGGTEPLITTIVSMSIPSERRGVYLGFQTLICNIGWTLAPLAGSYIALKYAIQSIIYIICPILLLAFFISLIVFRWGHKKINKGINIIRLKKEDL